MIERFPPLLAAVCLSIYWFWVVVKLIRLGRKIGKDPNALPREKVGRWMRVLWYPCIGVLLFALWMAAAKKPELFVPQAEELSRMDGMWGLFAWLWLPNRIGLWLAGAAGVICVCGTILTFICWRQMGRSWRIGIDPNEKLELVSAGPYRYVRHPIYALRIVINICVFIMAPTPLVLAASALDCLLLQIEARREERYMESKHGPEYRKYKNLVGRFVPRVFVG